jgi:hypothetical protein
MLLPVKADVTVPLGKDALKAALALAGRPAPRRAPRTHPPAPLPAPIFRADRAYAEMTVPTVEVRLLAVFRLWTVIAYFYPYLDLIGDWDAVLAEFIPKAIAANDASAYVMMMQAMAARVADGHTSLVGRSEFAAYVGGTAMARWPCGSSKGSRRRATHRRGRRARRRAAGRRRHRRHRRRDARSAHASPRALPYGLHRTARRARLARNLLVGPEGGTLPIRWQGADGRRRAVRLPLVARSASPPSETGPSFKLLEPDLGYADLSRPHRRAGGAHVRGLRPHPGHRLRHARVSARHGLGDRPTINVKGAGSRPGFAGQSSPGSPSPTRPRRA